MKITKALINKILDNYSIAPKEFEPIDKVENMYKSKIIKGYTITIEPETIGDGKAKAETGRLLVNHSNSKGKRIFIDVWEKDPDGKGYYWQSRNPINSPISDVAAYRDMQKELEKVKAAARELQKEYNILVSQKSNTFIETEKRKVGRPKETEKQKAKAAEIQKLIEDGKTNNEIMKALNITRATFFRLKQKIH